MRNPFQYGGVVSADAFCNRHEEMAEICRAVENCQKLFIYSERRLGKTSLVRQALANLSKDWVIIFVDLWPTDDVESFTIKYAKAVAEAFSPTYDKFAGIIKSAFSVLKPTMTFDESGQPKVEFGAVAAKTKTASLDDALEAPARISRSLETLVQAITEASPDTGTADSEDHSA